MRRALRLHRDFSCEAVGRLEAEAARPSPGEFALRFVLSGETARLRLPLPGAPMRRDELWRRTCFEAFVGEGEGAGYLEINLAPSGEWAVYGFTGYRAGMRAAGEAPPRVETRRSAGRFELSATLDLGAAGLRLDAPWRLALSAVIEDAGGAKSYWALAHPPGKPDFHHPESFVVALSAPEVP
jgi:hypothetical protein